MTDASVCVVGAGAAGAMATHALHEAPADVEVTVLEKSGGVCGRAATRRRDGCRYDHGANYVKDPDERTESFLRSLGTDGLVDVEEPVWTFGADSEIAPGDDRDEHKWTWTEGITQLAKRVFARTDATVTRRTRVASLRRDEADDRWTLTDTDDGDHGPFDAVLLTPPAPQTAGLLEATEWPGGADRLATLREAAAAVDYRTIRTLVFHYPFELDRPWYALVDVEKAHPVGWLAREECKDGHVPDGESLLIAQMSPDWSTAHYDDPLETAAPAGADLVADLVGDDRLRDPDWVDDQGWRYALPESGVDDGAAHATEEAGLFVAGDWVVGEGRVHRAMWNGHAVGDRIAGQVAEEH
jgi:predicted NAD/FAD-dependent oxidoreductase